MPDEMNPPFPGPEAFARIPHALGGTIRVDQHADWPTIESKARQLWADAWAEFDTAPDGMPRVAIMERWNNAAASVGWPLPFLSDAELRYPALLAKYAPNATNRDLVPGEDGQPYEAPVPGTPEVPAAPSSPVAGPGAALAPPSDPAAPKRRMPKIGDRVLQEPPERFAEYVEGVIEALARDDDGDVSPIVKVNGRWGHVVGWLA